MAVAELNVPNLFCICVLPAVAAKNDCCNLNHDDYFSCEDLTSGCGLCFFSQAMEVIQRHGLSAALFAPGWVYENLDKRHFFENQDKFVPTSIVVPLVY